MSNPSDAAESGFGLGLNYLTESADTALKAIGSAPLIGQAVSGAQSAYHLGSAVYDGVTGDRDGMVAHGTQALYNAAMVVPGASDVMGTADKALGIAGTGARALAEVEGAPKVAGQIPASMADVVSAAAVNQTNLLFGADKEKGTGTREGEIGAGVGAMEMMAAAGAGPIGMALAYANGNSIGRAIGHQASPGEGTSGNEPGFFARAGAATHDAVFGGD